ncbi:MAG: hypothetical protein LUC41_00140 [Clostridiales bacterium]|nr:hypothetical protein [Clostridiales bacterium]
MALKDFENGLKWDVPFNRDMPIPFVKHCGRPLLTKENYHEVFDMTSDLTPEEAASPFARYFAMGPACPSPENRLATEIGQEIDPSQAFTVEEYVNAMDKPNSCDLLTGYCVMPNGVGFAQMTTITPGCTAEVMCNFLDHFNPPGDLYYKSWFPGAHFCHYPGAAVEDVGYGVCYVRFLDGLTEKDVGMPIPGKYDKYCCGITGANVRHWPLHQPDRDPICIIELCYYRQLPDAYETRVTFWIGQEFHDGKATMHLPDGKPVTLDLVRSLCLHGVWETNTLMRNVMAFWKDCQD